VPKTFRSRDIPGPRPTPPPRREALFNILGDIEGFRLLDLFAGSGIISMEALSRGATQAIAIEQSRPACKNLKQAREILKLEEQWKITAGELPRALSRLESEHFDLIFADPPYDKGFAEQVPAWLSEQGISCDYLVIEESARVDPLWPSGWHEFKVRTYGDTTLHFLEQEEVE